jgi:hypothetical protein
VQSAECRTQNCPEEHTVKHPATHVLPLLFVFLAMRYEDALKSPKIDDRTLGSLDSSLSVCQTVTETNPQGTSCLISSSEMSFLGSASFHDFTSSLDLPPRPAYLDVEADLDWSVVTTLPLSAVSAYWHPHKSPKPN